MVRMTSAPRSPEYIESKSPAPRATAITLSVIIFSRLFGPERRLGPLCFRSASGAGYTVSFTEGLSNGHSR